MTFIIYDVIFGMLQLDESIYIIFNRKVFVSSLNKSQRKKASYVWHTKTMTIPLIVTDRGPSSDQANRRNYKNEKTKSILIKGQMCFLNNYNNVSSFHPFNFGYFARRGRVFSLDRSDISKRILTRTIIPPPPLFLLLNLR